MKAAIPLFALALALVLALGGCTETRDVLGDDDSSEAGDDDDATPGDDDDATPGDDDDSAGNLDECADPGDQLLRFVAGVDDWQSLSGDVTFDEGAAHLVVTAGDDQTLGVTFEATGVDLVPLVQPVLGPGTLLLASTGPAHDNGLVVVVSEEGHIFAAGYTHPGDPATQDVFGLEMTLTPIDDRCPDPEWEDECGTAVASSASLLVDGKAVGVFSQRWPGSTSEGVSNGGEFVYTLYNAWRLVESLCEDHPGREYSWSFTFEPGDAE